MFCVVLCASICFCSSTLMYVVFVHILLRRKCCFLFIVVNICFNLPMMTEGEPEIANGETNIVLRQIVATHAKN